MLLRTLPRRQSDGSWTRGHLTSSRVRATFDRQLAVSESGLRLCASRSGLRARSGTSPLMANGRTHASRWAPPREPRQVRNHPVPARQDNRRFRAAHQ